MHFYSHLQQISVYMLAVIVMFFVVCDEKDIVCKRDNISLEAVYEIHRLIDDDQNGNVDQSESDEVSMNTAMHNCNKTSITGSYVLAEKSNV